MSCQPYADAVVDPAAPRPADLAQHLSSCPDCRAVMAGHGAALRLAGTVLPERRVARPLPRLVAIAAVLLAVAAGAQLLRVNASGSTGSPRLEQAFEEPAGDGWNEFVALHQEVGGYGHGDTSLDGLSNVPQYFALDRLSSRVDALSQSNAAPSKESP